MNNGTRKITAAAIVAAALTGCAGTADPSVGAIPTADTKIDEPIDDGIATTDVALPAPSQAAAAQQLLDAMPSSVDGVSRSNGMGNGDVRYGTDGEVFGIEALDAGDVLASAEVATQSDLEAMVRSPLSCETTMVPCVRGTTDEGAAAAVWSSTDGRILYAAVAQTDERLQLLLDAWRRTEITAES